MSVTQLANHVYVGMDEVCLFSYSEIQNTLLVPVVMLLCLLLCRFWLCGRLFVWQVQGPEFGPQFWKRKSVDQICVSILGVSYLVLLVSMSYKSFYSDMCFTVLILLIPDYRMTSGSPLCLLSCVYVWGICLWCMHVCAHVWNLEERHEEYLSPYFPEKGLGLLVNPEPGWWPTVSVLHLLPPRAGLAMLGYLLGGWELELRSLSLHSKCYPSYQTLFL